MDTEVVQIMAIIVIALCSQIDCVSSLRCWQCIADNCDLNPSENYKATQKECLPGGVCQKVIYTDRYNNSTNPVSIVRSCSSRCIAKDNSSNCTLSKRGCVKRLCCQDGDFCNIGQMAQLSWLRLIVMALMPYWLLQFMDVDQFG